MEKPKAVLTFGSLKNKIYSNDLERLGILIKGRGGLPLFSPFGTPQDGGSVSLL